MKLWNTFPLIILLLLVSFGCSIKRTEDVKVKIDNYYSYSKDKKSPLETALVKIDSAILLAKKNGFESHLLKSVSLKSSVYSRNRQYLKAISAAEELKELSDSLENKHFLGKAYYKLGLYNDELDSLVRAYDYYVKSKNVFLNLNDYKEVSKRLLNMSIIQANIGDYLGSEITAIEGLNYLDVADIKLKYKFYNVISNVCRRQMDFKKALKYNEKAILLLEEKAILNKRDSLTLIKFLNNQALIYVKKGGVNKAYEILNGLIKTDILNSNKVTFIKERARIMSNLGGVKNELNLGSGFKELKRSYFLRDSLNDDIGLNSSFTHFSVYYGKLKMQDSSMYFANRALENSFRLGSLIAQNEVISKIYLLCDKYPNLYEGLKEKQYYQILTANELILKNKELELRDIYAKDKYNLELEENRTLKQRRQKYLFSGIGLVIILFGGVYFHYANKIKRERFKKQTAREVYNTEIRLSKKVHDELANDMYAVMTQLQHQTNEVELEALLDKLEVIYERSRDISRATGDIDTENFNAVLRQMLDGYTNDHVNVIMNGLVQGFWKEIAPYKKVEIFRVLRELMTNMKKHSKATLVVVRFKKEGKTLVVSYVDNGKGVDFNQIKYSNGLQNVENRIAGINGGIIFDSKPGKGFKAKITLT